MAVMLALIVVAVAFTVFCLVDIARAKQARHLPRAAWAVICLLSQPWGGIAYLIFGKAWEARDSSGPAPRWPMWHAR
jgi:Phospholipase_D-nuclease N-terminal